MSNISKIIVIVIILFVALGVCTSVIAGLRPHMHKSFMLEQIIYKKGN